MTWKIPSYYSILTLRSLKRLTSFLIYVKHLITMQWFRAFLGRPMLLQKRYKIKRSLNRTLLLTVSFIWNAQTVSTCFCLATTGKSFIVTVRDNLLIVAKRHRNCLATYLKKYIFCEILDSYDGTVLIQKQVNWPTRFSAYGISSSSPFKMVVIVDCKNREKLVGE